MVHMLYGAYAYVVTHTVHVVYVYAHGIYKVMTNYTQQRLRMIADCKSVQTVSALAVVQAVVPQNTLANICLILASNKVHPCSQPLECFLMLSY